jgi:excisionase family DNA binding protein
METLLDIYELGKLINIKTATLRKYVALRKIPFVKVGRLVRFSPAEIEQWLTSCKVPAQAAWKSMEPGYKKTQIRGNP